MFDVAIIGYGPVGSIMANLIAIKGHNILIIDANKGTSPTARAINTDGEQCRAFDLLGFAEEVIENTGYIDKVSFTDAELNEIITQDQPLEVGAMGWPPQLLFYQPELEKIIRSSVESNKNIVIKEETILENFSIEKDKITLSCSSNGEISQYECKYLIGCDGASSSVRKLLKIERDDLGYDQDWLVADAHLTQTVDIPRHHAKQVCNPKRPATYVPGRRGHRRFEFKLMPGESKEELEKKEKVWELLSPWINPDNASLERADVYQFHAALAKDWRIGNCLIAGDAAHQMPPFMGAGMGTGIRDAMNLFWKLDLVLSGRAGDDILDTYKAERYPHAKWTVAQSVSIGKIIEGICAQQEGKEFTPEENDGYGVKFPHLPSGIFEDASDEISGYPCPQPLLSRDGIKQLSDRVVGSKFCIFTRNGIPKLSDKAEKIIETLDIQIVELSEEDDEENRMEKIFSLYELILVRPDRYVYGGIESLDDASKIVESLETTFCLKI